MSIAQLKDAVKQARDAYDAAVTAYDNALKESCRFQPGDIIESSKGKKAKVLRIKVYCDDPVPFAVLLKKDGSLLREAPMWREEWQKAIVVGRRPDVASLSEAES